VFSQRSAELAVRYLGVRYECNQGGSFVGLGGSCYRFKGSYLLGVVSIFLEHGGYKYQFLSEAMYIRESRTDCWFAGW
jgi:hypothetical protein